MAKVEDQPADCECECGHWSETDAGPSSKMIQDEKDIRGVTPEVEKEMLEQGK
jgi:hypothetical protein